MKILDDIFIVILFHDDKPFDIRVVSKLPDTSLANSAFDMFVDSDANIAVFGVISNNQFFEIDFWDSK